MRSFSLAMIFAICIMAISLKGVYGKTCNDPTPHNCHDNCCEHCCENKYDDDTSCGSERWCDDADSSHTGRTVGIVIGVIVGVSVLVIVAFFTIRHQRKISRMRKVKLIS